MAVVEVVKYNGNPDVFAWKYPSEQLGTWTQVIVNESQEAILFKGGQALDLFPAGRHTLETANIPILNKIVNLPFGGRSPFTAEVWYINKIFSLDVKWGTPTPIQLQDPKYKIFISLRSFGQFGVQIEDSRKFLMKLVGTLPSFDKDNMLKFFRGLYLTKAKDAISTYLVHKKVSVLEINAYLDELSEYIKDKMIPIMSEYGIKLVNFYVNDINIPEDDPAVNKLKEALAKRAEMDIVGYDYAQERSFDTLEGAATNPGSAQSGLMGAGVGLGMGVGLGGAMGPQFSRIAENIKTSTVKTLSKSCPNCNAAMEIEKRFCSECGHNFEEKQEKNETTCSNCNFKYGKNVKFCPECGTIYNPCPECEEDVKEGADNCHKCGSSMPKPCSNCSTLLKGKMKFCPECGTTLVKRCSNCNFEIDGTPKFCPECGNKI
ncbi:SPFH domain-containing protein [Alkaliphilus peptidifermentans]|uniref:Membrane protease subunit, stomatin/prohibitin family, contains C-terminal Zn-ribbon domain n=1 Tax=Alkaliphilus peptidifermentans DSM 18978 TaxID=1120976 RepID=A0A1G5JT06_9FIRM|nr:SPFH domain-containing protein [Alkaliphilus peptidifermentans]SCY91284.1 Membrane protease subunit, stomatin/prohibitin family, contains C-terminal Zn-ribbon domain [Alkaliphilus peptidifermentans DSM 18978]